MQPVLLNYYYFIMPWYLNNIVVNVASRSVCYTYTYLEKKENTHETRKKKQKELIKVLVWCHVRKFLKNEKVQNL